jgi:hypothetical protein
VRPSHPLAELADHWCPIFVDPARDYHYLASLRSFRWRDVEVTAQRNDGELRLEEEVDGTTIVWLQPEGPCAVEAKVV